MSDIWAEVDNELHDFQNQVAIMNKKNKEQHQNKNLISSQKPEHAAITIRNAEKEMQRTN